MEPFVCGNIAFSNGNIKEMDGRQVIISINRTDIIRIEIHHGTSVEKPISHIIIGLVMIVIGCSLGISPILGFLSSLHKEHVGRGLIVAFAIPFIILGVSLILSVFQKHNYLLIFTKYGRRKLTIKDCTICDIVDAGKRFGFTISVPTNQ